VSPEGEHVTLTLHPFWTTLQALSAQLPESVQLPWAFTQLPLPPPPSLLELQASAKESQAAANTFPFIPIGRLRSPREMPPCSSRTSSGRALPQCY
jgi:hypothetical protein